LTERLPIPYDPSCKRYARDIATFDFFIPQDPSSVPAEPTPTPTAEQREAYIRENESTYNPENGHFLCDECHVKAGMPAASEEWKCP
jgi:hypothetical protein